MSSDARLPRRRPHRVSIVTFPDAQILDVTGPLEVFSRAARWLRDEGRARRLPYVVEILAREAGPVRMSSGLELVAARAWRDADDVDTLLISGGIGCGEAAQDAELVSWIRAQEARVTRLGSICTGAMILAATGLLDGRRATTHWNWCDALERDHPRIEVDRDALFVRQGRIYTAAGVTAGMDLALAMVEDDWGRDAALQTARELVMYLKRPSGQPQVSAHLAVQEATRQRFRDLERWILDHPDAELTVERLAARVAMSPRHFARVFAQETGTSPAKFVAAARLELARRRLEESELTLDAVARECGYVTSENMRRAFKRRLGLSPREYRKRIR